MSYSSRVGGHDSRERLISYICARQGGFISRMLGDMIIFFLMARRPQRQTSAVQRRSRSAQESAQPLPAHKPLPAASSPEKPAKSPPPPAAAPLAAPAQPVPPPVDKRAHLQPLWPEDRMPLTGEPQDRRKAPRWYRASRVLAKQAKRSVRRFHKRTPMGKLLWLYFGPLAAFCIAALAFLLIRGAPEMAHPLVLTKEQEVSALMSRTEEALQDSDTDEAWKDVQRLRELRPQDYRVENYAGVTLSLRKDYPAAREAFQHSLRLKPDNYATEYNLAEIEFATKNYPEAKRLYEKVLLHTSQKGLTGYRLYTCLLLLGKQSEAEAVFQRFPVPPKGRSPAWFYAQSTQAFLAGNATEGNRFLDLAHQFAPSQCQPYDLVLRRLGYIK